MLNWKMIFSEQLANARNLDTRANWARNILDYASEQGVDLEKDLGTNQAELIELERQFWAQVFLGQLRNARTLDARANWARNILDSTSEHAVDLGKDLNTTKEELLELERQYWKQVFGRHLKFARLFDTGANWARHILEHAMKHAVDLKRDLDTSREELLALERRYQARLHACA